MKKYKVGILIGVVIVIGLVYFKTSQTSSGVLKIGVISSLTGDYGAIGENFVKGVKTAESIYEQKTGKKVEFVIEDDGGDGVKGLSAFNKLSQIDHVNGLMNFFTTTMDTIYGPAKSAGYPVMMLAFQANNVADDYVFQMTPGNDDVWPKYSAYIKSQDYDLSNVVLVYSKAAAQESFAKAFAEIYADKTTSYTVSSNGKDGLRADAAKIASLKPTTIIFFMTPDDGAILTKELTPILSKSVRLIYDIQLVTGTANYKKILGGLSPIEGAITLSPEGEPNQEFIYAYHKLYPNETPGFLADFGYDTFNVYIKNYDPDNTKWIDNLRTVDIDGASGHIKFNKVGVRVPDLVIKKVIGGELTNVTRLKI